MQAELFQFRNKSVSRLVEILKHQVTKENEGSSNDVVTGIFTLSAEFTLEFFQNGVKKKVFFLHIIALVSVHLYYFCSRRLYRYLFKVCSMSSPLVE